MMQRLTIRQILAILLFLPLISAILSLWQIMPSTFVKLNEAETMAASVEISAAAADLVHELQAERGTTVGLFAASQETRGSVRNRLMQQQEKTDEKLVLFEAATAKGRLEKGLEAGMNQFALGQEEMLNNLKSVRERGLGRMLTPTEIITIYTNIIDYLINGVNILSDAGQKDAVSSLKHALKTLAIAKDYAGLERATGNAFLASGAMNPVTRERLSGFSAIHIRFMQHLPLFLREDHDALMAQYLPQDVVQPYLHGLEVMRTADGMDVPDYSAAQWWEASTKRIDQLKKLEGILVARLEQLGQDNAQKAWSQMLFTLGMQGVLLLFGVGITFWIGQGLSSPLRRASDALDKAMAGDEDVAPPPLMSTKSEIGRISNAVGSFIAALKERAEITREREAANAKLEESRRAVLVHMERELGEASGEATSTLQQAAATLNEKASEMLTTVNAVKLAQDDAQEAAQSSGETVREVTRLSEELSKSITEIAEQTTRTAQITQEVLGRAQNSRESAKSFEEVANAIGSIVGIINAIAGQTNLLALNATIEAARAGETGRGFAVVAGEVKSLAARTMEATRTIEAKVGELKTIARTAAEQSTSLSEEVANIQGLNASIAAAVHQQQMTSEGFGDSIHGLVQVMEGVVREVEKIAALGSNAYTSAQTVQGVADEMDRTTATLVETLPRLIAETSRRVAG